MAVKSYPYTDSNLYTFDNTKVEVSGGLASLKEGSNWITGWSYRKQITIDNTNVGSDLTDFPLLVKINNDSDIGNGARSDGFDIRFQDSNGTTLKYEREFFDIASGGLASGIFWVKVPTINNVSTTDIYIYYGKFDAIDGEDAVNVWTNNYIGVWHMNNNFNESTGNDSSAINDSSTSTTGKIANGRNYAGSPQYTRFTSSLSTARSIEFWVKRDSWSGYTLDARTNLNAYIYQATVSGFDQLHVNGISVGLSMNNAPTGEWAYVHLTASANFVPGINVYSRGNTNWGSQGGIGDMDEFRISSIVRTAEWIKFGYYNVNEADNELSFGGEAMPYSTDKPTIEPTTLLDPITVSAWDSFLETLGGGNQGNIGYNLYKVDKANKYYWNGGAWVTGGSENNYNTVATINANIGSFDASPDKIGFIAYLISDGEQTVEIDENQTTYTINQAPLVNAGSNKTAQHETSITPFSDCSFSDIDGTIDHVYYDIEGSGWTEILIGSFGSLLEAVQAFTYLFNNIGDITCNLRVEDNEGTTADDSLVVTVEHYTVIFNCKDSQGNHLANINFKPGDGSGWIVKESPFTHKYEYNVSGYDIVIDKSGYSIETQNVVSTDHIENFTLISLVDSTDENFRIVNPIYDINGNMTSATKKVYRTADDCENDINVMTEYEVVAIYSNNNCISYKTKRV